MVALRRMFWLLKMMRYNCILFLCKTRRVKLSHRDGQARGVLITPSQKQRTVCSTSSMKVKPFRITKLFVSLSKMRSSMRQHRCIDLSDMMICPCQKHARLMNGNMLAPSFYPQIHCRSLMSTARSKPLMSIGSKSVIFLKACSVLRIITFLIHLPNLD